MLAGPEWEWEGELSDLVSSPSKRQMELVLAFALPLPRPPVSELKEEVLALWALTP